MSRINNVLSPRSTGWYLFCALAWLAHTGVLVGLAAASVATTALLLIGAQPNVSLGIVVFLSTVASYALDRVSDRERDGHAQRSQALANTRLVQWLGVFLLGVAAALCIAECGLVGLLSLAGMPLAVLLYVIPWIGRLVPPLRRRNILRIKDIPLLKAFYVTACWLVLVPFAALFEARPWDARLCVAAAFIAPFLFVNAVACDVRDVVSDRLAGVLTFPVFCGVPRTLTMLRIVNGLWACAFVTASAFGLLPPSVWALPLQSLLVEISLVQMRRPKADIKFYGDVVFDGILVIHPALCFAGTRAYALLE